MVESFAPLFNIANHVHSLSDVAYRQLREAILNCSLEPGQLLRQEDIASRLGISRLPVREALQRLESEGLVVLRPRRGFIVAYISKSEILDVFDARGLLESRAAYLATQARGERDVEDLRRLLELSNEAIFGKEPDCRRFFELNLAFHDRLLQPLDRPHLQRLVRMMRSAGERYIRLSVRLSEDLAPSAAEHQRIFEAYAAGDAAEAAQLCQAHCIATMHRLLDNLDKRGLSIPWGSPVATPAAANEKDAG